MRKYHIIAFWRIGQATTKDSLLLSLGKYSPYEVDILAIKFQFISTSPWMPVEMVLFEKQTQVQTKVLKTEYNKGAVQHSPVTHLTVSVRIYLFQ